MLDALTRLVVRRPWWVLAVTLLLVIGAALTGADVADRLRAGQGTEDPSSESAMATRLLEEHFPQARPNLILLVTSANGVDDRKVARTALEIAESIAYEDGVSGTVSYWQTGSGELKSQDGKHALIAARLSGSEAEAGGTAVRLAERYGGTHGPLSIRAGGQTAVLDDVETTIAEDLLRAELLALPLTLLILLWVFGSVASAALPLAIGAISIVATNAVLRLVASVTDVSVFAQNLTIGLGLGLSIDYALLMVRRFRSELALGLDSTEAALSTVRTAGRTVVFSALAISVALMSMLLFPLYFLRSFAYAGVSVVFFAALASIVVLPAALVLLGRRTDALSPGRLLPRALRQWLSEEAGERRWVGLARVVMSKPALFAVLSTSLLLLMGAPFLRVEFGMADDRQLPREAESRQVMDLLREEFGDAAAGTIDIVIRADGNGGQLADYTAAISALPGVAEVRSPSGIHSRGALLRERTPVDALFESGGYVRVQAVLEGGIVDVSPESQHLVREIRSIPAPAEAAVAGPAASVVDAQAAIAGRLPFVLGCIVTGMMLLVFLLTGSVLLPLLSVFFNALSLTAMFGAVVWVFQDGRFAEILGFTPTGFIDTALPVLMFCIAFGLSTDYGVFLLSRMREEYERTGDARIAIERGLSATGGVITAAALALATVLIVIGMSRVTNSMMLGWGVALAVVADATIVRCLLVPSVLRLFGRAAWWVPAPLARVQRVFDRTLGERSAEVEHVVRS